MRFSPAAMALSLTVLLISSAGIGKNPDYQIDALSLEIQKQGDEAFQAKENSAAIDYYQTALAVDPRNRGAYVAMARVVRAQGLNGKAIRYYSEALELDPGDMTALAEQADIMLAKGAVTDARKNLARLQLLCRMDCAAVAKLATAINTSDEKPTLQASAVDIKPVVGDTVEKAN